MLEVYAKMSNKLSKGTINHDEHDGFMLYLWMIIINHFAIIFLLIFFIFSDLFLTQIITLIRNKVTETYTKCIFWFVGHER